LNNLRKILLLLINIVFIAGIVRADNSGDFSFKVGIGYDFISQEYFYDSLGYSIFADSSADLYVAASILEKDYLDDKKGLAYIKFDSGKKGKKVLELGWEQTPEFYRAVGRGNLLLGKNSDFLDVDFDFDMKKKYRGEKVEGEEITTIGSRLKYRHAFANGMETSIHLKAENVDFDSTGQYIYNYSKIGYEAGLIYFSPEFNSIHFLVSAENRFVPDSARMEYFSFRTSLGYSGVLFKNQFVGEITFENRSYNQSDEKDDYRHASILSIIQTPIRSNKLLKSELMLDYFDYNDENTVYDDYLVSSGKILFGLELDRISLAVGPHLEFLSFVRGSNFGENYWEYAAHLEFDFYNLNKIFLLFENQFGKRNYPSNHEFYSNYVFDRASLLGNIRIWKNLSFDIMFSAEWEWHKKSSDNSRLFLFSSSFNYSF
jgi:hypothetical protein